MNNTAFLISCSDHYSHRMYLWDLCLQAKGYATQYITSDFDHSSKRSFQCSVSGCVQLPVRPYHKNLSADRILSHRMFAKAVKKYVEAHHPAVIIALLPPNFLAHYLAKYKRKHPDTVLIFDIFDMWPETFPSARAKKLLAPFFSVWAGLRDRSLPTANHIVTECDLFRSKLRLDSGRASTVHLCAADLDIPTAPKLRSDTLELCYLGAINNVIGISDICELIQKLSIQKPVTLHIIGGGEQAQTFIDRAKAAGAKVVFYGPVYDPVQKMQIMDQCHFGLNIMKPEVCVGLTMKSVDYFRFGLPVINSIPADTRQLLQTYRAGIQLDGDCARKVLALSVEDCMAMRQNVKFLFCTEFTEEHIREKMTKILDQFC